MKDKSKQSSIEKVKLELPPDQHIVPVEHNHDSNDSLKREIEEMGILDHDQLN